MKLLSSSMASPPLSQYPRATVCLECGDEGEKKLLVYCRNCKDSAIHSYCMEVITPNDDNIKWWCWDCRGEDIIQAEPSRKSERITLKRQKAQTMRNNWKQKLNRRKKLVRISKDINETGRLDIDGQGLEANLANKRQRVILEKEKSVPEIVSNSERDESIKIDEPTFTTDSKLPDEQEDMVMSFDEIQAIPESGNNDKILVVVHRDNAQIDGKDVDLQVSRLVADNLPSAPDTFCRQPYLEPDDSLTVEPVIVPIWRGWFNIKAETEMISIEILAHLSNKAHSKVSEAAAAMPPILDLQLVNKHAALPKRLRDEPPTAASIGLYFFPASERDERVYDSLLEEVMDRDLALKVVINNNLQLLIFPSSELPLQNWRYKSKTFLWGMYRNMQRSYSSAEASSSGQWSNNTQRLRLSQATAIGNKGDLVCSQHAHYSSQNFQSPMSMKSSQSSNILPSMQNTPESLALSLS